MKQETDKELETSIKDGRRRLKIFIWATFGVAILNVFGGKFEFLILLFLIITLYFRISSELSCIKLRISKLGGK